MAAIVAIAVTFRRAGTEQMILELARRSVADGDVVHVIVPPSVELDGFAAEIALAGAATHRIGPLYESERSPLRNAIATYRLLRRLRPAVVHLHFPWAPLCFEVVVASMLARVPLRMRTDHNPISEPLSRKQRTKMRVLDAMVHRIVTVSEGNLRSHLTNGGRPAAKSAVIMNGIDMSEVSDHVDPIARARGRAELGLAPEDTAFVMVAALEIRKGVFDFIEAVARCHGAAGSRSRFCVVGAGELLADAERLAIDRGVADDVIFLGQRGDVRSLLELFDVYVLPSHHEGLSIAMLEALAAGLPMISTRVDGLSDVLPGEQGVIAVDVGDVAALATAMDGLAADGARRHELAAISSQRVREEFSADRMYAQYRTVYDSAARPAGSVLSATA